MKVLMIDTWLPSQPYVLELSRPLSGRVTLTLLTNKYFKPEKEPFPCKCVLESKVKEKKLGYVSYFLGLLSLYRAVIFGRYDVIHLQTFKQMRFEAPAFRIARRLTKKKLVYTAHNILPHERGGQKEADALRKWYRLCDAIMVHNEHSRNVLLGFEPSVREKVHVIAHGTFDEYAPFVKDTAPHEKTVFLQFGMIRKYKGIDDLLKAASLLPEAYRKKIRIVIAGNQRKDLDDTDYRAMLEGYGVGDFVEFLPQRIPDGQVPDYFNGSDCCLFPYKEIFGSGALLMAYSFDKPVIASAIPTFREETDGGKTGLLYDPQNPLGLTEAIERFTDLSEAERNGMKENVRRIRKTKYSWSVSADALAAVYRSVTGGSGK